MRVTENREYQQAENIYKQRTTLDEENPLPDRWVSTPVAVQEERRKNKKNESIYYLGFPCYHYYVQRE